MKINITLNHIFCHPWQNMVGYNKEEAIRITEVT